MPDTGPVDTAAGDGTAQPAGDGTPQPAGDGTPQPAGDGTPQPAGDGTPQPAGDGTAGAAHGVGRSADQAGAANGQRRETAATTGPAAATPVAPVVPVGFVRPATPTVIVTIDYRWLIAELAGHGLLPDTGTPISPAAARALACDAKILPIVLGGGSLPLDVGRSRRLFTPAQRHALAIRDRGCLHPGCDRPLSWCDIHHIRPWAVGGATTLENAATLCRFHHPLYDRGEWQLLTDPTGPTAAIPPPFLDTTRRPIPICRQ